MSKRTKRPAVDVALYDRVLLEHHEVQPVTTQDGHTITVDTQGRFGAIMGDVTIQEGTLEETREKVHTTHLAQLRKLKKKTMAVPCVIYDPASDYKEKRARWVGLAFFRGVHAGNGALQYSHLDGTKVHGEGVIVWGRGDGKLVDRLMELESRMTIAQAEVDEATKELKELCQEQGPKMYVGTVQQQGYRHAFNRPRVHNDAARAQEVADRIVLNVLSEGDEEEE